MAHEGLLDHGDWHGRISHVFPNTADSEDIAEGQPDVASVVDAWMSSAGHRRNILGDYTIFGVGEARSRSGQLYWVVDFAKV
jgi:uncharacterized protein YkwD